jgi:hypothetical protein
MIERRGGCWPCRHLLARLLPGIEHLPRALLIRIIHKGAGTEQPDHTVTDHRNGQRVGAAGLCGLPGLSPQSNTRSPVANNSQISPPTPEIPAAR